LHKIFSPSIWAEFFQRTFLQPQPIKLTGVIAGPVLAWMKPRPPLLCTCCGAPMQIVRRRLVPEKHRPCSASLAMKDKKIFPEADRRQAGLAQQPVQIVARFARTI